MIGAAVRNSLMACAIAATSKTVTERRRFGMVSCSFSPSTVTVLEVAATAQAVKEFLTAAPVIRRGRPKA